MEADPDGFQGIGQKEQRLTDLRKILEEQGRVRTRDLAQMLDVTPETLRSDLDLLESQGLRPSVPQSSHRYGPRFCAFVRQ